MSKIQIQQRKKDHVELTSNESTQYAKTSGFEKYEFVHNALPEIDYNQVSTETDFLGNTFAFPLFISSMTGGYEGASSINAIIAEFCEKYNLPFGVGSQRAMLEDANQTKTFSIVRKKAPSAFICANIGGAQLINGLHKDKVQALIDSIEANAIIVHLNPLQELMQPEGDRNFTGILDGIQNLVLESHVPIIVKETGAGISKYVAKKLLNVGVSVIDIAGSGGTSWAKVENARKDEQDSSSLFDEWGISTVDCLLDIGALQWERNFELIASGGIRSSFDIAKSICLGASFAATAQPLIKVIRKDGMEGLEALFTAWQKDLKIILTLLGCSNLKELNNSHIRLKTGL
ncbi:MAG: type 2 isopentenyl-diphosphate Delta-isomerase [Balneolaceae bacterium]